MEFGQLPKPLILGEEDILKSEQPFLPPQEVKIFGSTKVHGQLFGYLVLVVVGQKSEK